MKLMSVVSCWTKCQSEDGLYWRLMRTLEAMAEQAIFHIMPWSSCFVIYIKSGRNIGFLFDSWKHNVRDACFFLDGGA